LVLFVSKKVNPHFGQPESLPCWVSKLNAESSQLNEQAI